MPLGLACKRDIGDDMARNRELRFLQSIDQAVRRICRVRPGNSKPDFMLLACKG